MKRKMMVLVVLALVFSNPLWLSLARPVAAQTGGDDLPVKVFMPMLRLSRTYDITGQVTGPNGLPVSGALVVAQNGQSAVSGPDGRYTMADLSPGEYALAASKDGLSFLPAMTPVTLGEANEVQNFAGVAACSDVIINGSFESDTTWVFPITEYTAGYTVAAAHTGVRAMRAGLINTTLNKYSYSSGRQKITIPLGTTSANLRVWLYPTSTEATAQLMGQPPPALPLGTNMDTAVLGSDVQYVLVLDAYNNLIETLLWTLRNDQQWLVFDFNLSKYAGRTITIQVGALNDGYGGITGLYADDVALEICADDGGAPPPTGVCGNALLNPGFEFTGNWNIPVTTYPAGYTTLLAQSGLQSMRTGITNDVANRYSYSEANQTVTIPENATRAVLGMYYYLVTSETVMADASLIHSEQVSAQSVMAGDLQYIFLIDEDGVTHVLWSNLKDQPAWNYKEIDVLDFAGQTVQVGFGSYNDGWGGITAMFVDDAILDMCAEAVEPTPTPTPGPTPTPTPTPVPGTCTEKFVNTDFELATGWGIPITVFSAGYSTLQAHSGVQSMRTGIVYTAHNRYSYSDAYQTAWLPSSATSIKLGMWIYPQSGEPVSLAVPDQPTAMPLASQALSGDVQYILLLDWYGNWIDTLYWTRSNASAWQYVEFDLTRYRGYYIRVQFGTYNDGWGGVTSMFVDDATLQVCP